MTRLALAALLLPLMPAVAAGDSLFSVTIQNRVDADLTGMSVDGDAIENFRTIRARQTRDIRVTLGEGQCNADVELTFSDNSAAGGVFNFCTSNVLIANDG